MGGHRARVGVMAWSSHLLSSGSRDRNILQRDIRAPEDFQSKLLGHRSEACLYTCLIYCPVLVEQSRPGHSALRHTDLCRNQAEELYLF